jgi:hypothetical protein
VSLILQKLEGIGQAIERHDKAILELQPKQNKSGQRSMSTHSLNLSESETEENNEENGDPDADAINLLSSINPQNNGKFFVQIFINLILHS